MKFNMNRMESTHNVAFSCLYCPVKSFMMTYDNMPRQMPSAMLYVRTIVIMVMKAGKESLRSFRFISFMESSI